MWTFHKERRLADSDPPTNLKLKRKHCGLKAHLKLTLRFVKGSFKKLKCSRTTTIPNQVMFVCMDYKIIFTDDTTMPYVLVPQRLQCSREYKNS